MGLFKKSLRREDYVFVPHGTYVSRPREGFEPDAFRFSRFAQMMVQLMASDWFDNNLKSIRDVLGDSPDVDVEKLIREEQVDGDGELPLNGVQESLLNTHQRFENAHRIAWSDSYVAQAWQSCLESNGVSLYSVPCPQDPSIDKVFGPWQLFDNQTALPLHGEAWADNATGEEFVYWFFDALVWLRYPHQTQHLHPSLAFYLPRVMQRLAYISECSMPSVPIRMKTRAMEFGVDSPEQAPRIAIHGERDYGVLSVTVGRQGTMAVVDWSPQTVRYGYILDNSTPFETNFDLVATIVDALPKVASMLTDGYHEWLKHSLYEEVSVLPYDFQEQFFSDDELIDEESGWSFDGVVNNFFIAGPAYGAYVQETISKLQATKELAADQKLMQSEENLRLVAKAYENLSVLGAAPYSIRAADAFHRDLYRDELPALPQWGESNRTFLRGQFRYLANYRVDYHDVRALSVLAAFESAWGDTESALASANDALSRLDAPSTGASMLRVVTKDDELHALRLGLLITIIESYIDLGNVPEVEKYVARLAVDAAKGSVAIDHMIAAFREWIADSGSSSESTDI